MESMTAPYLWNDKRKNIMFNNRKIQDDGTVILNNDGLLEYLYIDSSLSNVCFEDTEEVKQYNELAKIYNLPILKNINNKQNNDWFMPNKYKTMDVYDYFHSMSLSEVQLLRVDEELMLYEKYHFINALKFIIYLIDYMKSNSIIWGVGRGSSSASYLLYLVDLHMVDSLAYNIPITEFLHD